MNALDIAVLLLLVAGAGLGALLGLVWQVTGLFSLLFASFAAMAFGPVLGEILEGRFGLQAASVVIGYAIIFILANLFVRLAAKGMAMLLKVLQLQAVDRILGGVIGFAVVLHVAWGGLFTIGRFGSEEAQILVEGSLAGRVALRAGDRVALLADDADAGEMLFGAAESLSEVGARLEEARERVPDDGSADAPAGGADGRGSSP
jgi:uncharacterized membrane protein required for colicin V production